MKNEGFAGKTQSVAVLLPYEKREGSSESIPRASNGTGMPASIAEGRHPKIAGIGLISNGEKWLPVK